MVNAVATSTGNSQTLTRLLQDYLVSWLPTVESAQKRLPFLSGPLALATTNLKLRGTDPLFMTWVSRLERVSASPESFEIEGEPPPVPTLIPRVGAGRFLRLGLNDCAELARMMYGPEQDSSLSTGTIDREVAAALELLTAIWPEAVCDMEFFARALFVVEAPSGYHSSGSDASLPFILKVTCAPGTWSALLADSLVHETAHVKLRLAMRLAPFCHDDDYARFRHPWRREARPLSAVLLAAHAFVSVYAFYVRLVKVAEHSRAACEESLRLRAEVGEVLTTLLGAPGLTDLGRQLVSRLVKEYEAQSEQLNDVLPRPE